MEIRWKVTDPLGNEVFLGEENFRFHIVGLHDSKDAQVRAQIEPQAKFAVEHPRFIVCDDMIHIRQLFIVTEAYGKVVTWFAKRSVNVKIPQDGGIIYDERTHRL